MEKNVIPVKYFYYGMLACALFIATVFFFLWSKESNQTKALDEKGVKVNAWVVNLYSTKASKRASSNYNMEVGFFTNATQMPKSTPNETNTNLSESDKLIQALAKQTESLRHPLGDFETQKIPLSGYDAFKRYQLNDTVIIEYLPEDHSVLRLVYN